MKTLFSAILLFMATVNAFGLECAKSDSSDPISMEIYKKMTQTTTDIRERSLSNFELSAYLNSELKEVEVNLYNIGDV